MKPIHSFIAFSLLALFAAGAARLADPTAVHRDMTAAAQRWLDSLPVDLKARAQLPFDSPARTDWHYVPRTRPGLRMADMNDAQRSAARDLLRAALSSRGLDKVEAIMALDGVLRDLERSAGGSGGSRDPGAYAFTIYGPPSNDSPWAWKIEGHHISLNFTCASTASITVTPAFLGANPAEIPSGPKKGERALAAEEDLARRLLTSLDDDQRRLALIANDAPADIVTAPGRDLNDPAFIAAGLPASSLHPDQRDLLEHILHEHAHNLRAELADAELERIRAAGLDNIRFAWAGGREHGQPHYYRLAGPTFIIEYDNTQDHANHIHTVWHDRQRDFGLDALKDHYEHDHQHAK